jgi:hypothetical protein
LPPPSSGPAPGLASIVIPGVPHVRQKPDFCGEAATESWLRARGHAIDQDRVFDLSGLDPARGMGATTRELKTALERLGFAPGPVWHSVAVDNADLELSGLFRELHADLARGVPSIVCTRFDEDPNTTEHFRLVLGYDAHEDAVVYHDPAEDTGAYRRMPRQRFLGLWPLKYEAARWTVIRLRLEGTRIQTPPLARGFSPADFAQHVMRLRKRVPRGFSIVVEPPFVVIGDGSAESVRATSQRVVRWAADRLERDFFSRRPNRILDVWLFDGKESYERHTRALFDEEPTTPYGFYSSRNDALVMNIRTGGGTLVHEIVHPYVEANFPDAPAWLNEGLGSLYEQSSERDGHIIGLTNWRLPGLQGAIRAGNALPFSALCATSSDEFYGDDSGLHYAQARYLLYYLQEHGLLVRFYREFFESRASDPTGYRTLVRVLGERDMRAFQRRWERWVLGLRFG